MKIVHIVLSNGADYTDSWGYQENTLPEEHVRLGHDVTVVTSTFSSLAGTEREKTAGQYEINGVRVVRINPALTFAHNRIAFFPQLYDVLTTEKPQLIFVHGFLMPSLNKVRKYKKKNPDVIVFFDAHNTYVNSLKKYPRINEYLMHKGLWRLIYQCNKDVFCKGYYTAHQVKTFLKDMYCVDEKILSFLPMGVYISEGVYENRSAIRNEYREKYDVSEFEKLLVVGGRLREDKRILEIVKAVDLLEVDGFKLLVFGSFQSKEYEESVRDAAGKNVLFAGWQDNKSMQNIYFASDLGLFTGTQSVIWRTAVGCGLPALCRYSDGVEELDLGGNCLFLDSDEPKIWAEAIERILTDENQLQKMKEIAETKGTEFFSEERIAQSIIDDYQLCKDRYLNGSKR